MNKEIIMRPVYNRPEFFYLSLEAEIKAREYYMIPSKFHTLFIVEYGAPKKIFDLIDEYPFDHSVIVRDQKFGLTKNILEGMKSAFELTSNYIIYIEDDILVHKTYFKYMDLLLNMNNLGPYTVLSAYNKNDDGSINEVYKGDHYCAWGALITKKFFNDYIIRCVNSSYYANYATRDRFVRFLDDKFKYCALYKYKNKPGMHNEQAGLLHRLTNISAINDGSSIIMPCVNRQIHIGLVGKNRPGKLSGATYEERLANMRYIIKNNKFYEVTQSKQYNDYLVFDKRLNKWDGKLILTQ